MHRQNEEAWLNPETSQIKATVSRPIQREDRLPPINTVSGFAPVQTSMYARGYVFPNQTTLHQLIDLDKYRLGLKQQVEEKHLKQAEEREKLRLEDEKEERKLAEQRAQIKREFDEEKENLKVKQMKQPDKNKELVHLAEDKKKKEVEEKKKEVEEIAAGRMRYEKERQARFPELQREISPPIPTLRKRHRAPQSTPTPPSMDSKHSTSYMSQKAKHEELVHLLDKKKKELVKKTEVEEKEIAAGRMRYEKERQARFQDVRREFSPPIPTLQKRHRGPQSTSSPPSMDSKHPTTPLSKGSLSVLQSQTPSIPAVRKELRAAGCVPENTKKVLCTLSAIRQKLQREQKRVKGLMMRSE